VLDKTLCDMIMLKCSKHLCSFVQYRLSTEAVPNFTGHHFFQLFCTKFFLITNMRVATEEFFSVMHSCCCSTGLGLGLGLAALVLVLVFLVLQFWSWSWS